HLLSEPAASAVNVAVVKAHTVSGELDEVVVAADTLVVIDRDMLAKPAAPDEAWTMLDRLRGRQHQVLTGVALQSADLEWAGVVSTQVLMRAYSDAEMEAYLARGEPFDKAGGYAVQDSSFRPVERLSGCYLNVVGLPVCAVVAGVIALGAEALSAGRPPCTYCERGATLVRSG